MADIQILATGRENVPEGYTIPVNQEIVLKGVSAVIDGSNASGDFVPVLRIIPGGNVGSLDCPLPQTISSGGSAKVNWFPFVGARGSSKLAGFCDGGYDGQTDTVSVPDSTVVDLRNHVGTSYATAPNFTSSGAAVLGESIGDYLVVARAEWAASFAGDRYMTVYQSNAGGGDDLGKPVTFRENTSPNGDVMWVAAGFNAGAPNELPMEFKWDVFQASGGPQTLQNYTYQIYCLANIWPLF